MLPREAAGRRLWVVRGTVRGRTASVVVEAATQREAAYLGWKRGLPIVIVEETAPYSRPAGDAIGMVAGPAPRSAYFAFGHNVSAAQRAVLLAAGVAVAVLNWRLAALPLSI